MTKQEGDCGYIAIYNRTKVEIWAKSLYAAKLKAIEHFKVRKPQEHMVSVCLCERADGTAVETTL